MNTPRTALVPVLIASLAVAAPAGAVKYLTLGEAVKTFIPADAKVFKVTKQLTAKQRKRLSTDYGWEAKDDAYVFYEGKAASGEVLGYVYVVAEAFNTCFHKYAVGMKPDGKVIDTVVVELSCPRAFPVNRKSFLKQFQGKRHVDPLTTKLDIDGVSGATLSSESTAQATRKAVSLHNLLLGPAEPVNLSPDARAARAKADGMIQKAIATGETLSKDGQGAAQLPPEPGK